MKATVWTALVVIVVGLAGCSGANAYRKVDLSRNLAAEDVARYEREYRALPADERGGGSATVESSNWWPLGLVAYHRDDSVVRMAGSDGPMYMVSQGRGYGPLCLIYNRSVHATFNAQGERLSGMSMSGVLLGHLAMFHAGDAILSDGRHEKSSSMGLIHHLLNFHTMDGHTYFSLFSIPNPIGFHGGGGDDMAHMHAH